MNHRLVQYVFVMAELLEAVAFGIWDAVEQHLLENFVKQKDLVILYRVVLLRMMGRQQFAMVAHSLLAVMRNRHHHLRNL